jgi:hypothetical protein
MSYYEKSEFVDKYLSLCEKYGYYVGNSSAYGEARVYEIVNTGKVLIQGDEMFEGHREQLLEDLG